MHIILDEREIETVAGRTVLEVARENGVHIPTLCHHEALEPFGACRLCMVEVNTGSGWRLVASCAYPCSEGLLVRTESDKIFHSRRNTIELLMASASQVPLIRNLAEDYGVTKPLFSMDEDDCILCGLCVRACHEIVGIGAISVINRGIDKKVGTPFAVDSMDCIGCATCVLVCPTGAIHLADIREEKLNDHSFDTAFDPASCEICGQVKLTYSLVGNHNSQNAVTESRPNESSGESRR
ncbi:MAG: 4Fe-4S dicluster domain-containing protein [Anaerolineales bacterium]|nr:4Fe-4S dicluster domain-containing protein [Anaerolineales bacterium]